MRIGFDLNPIVIATHRERGIGRSTYSLARHLVELSSSREDERWADTYGKVDAFFFYFRTPNRRSEAAPPIPFQLSRANFHVGWRPLPTHAVLPGHAHDDRLSLLHLQDYLHPLYSPGQLPPRGRLPFRLLITVQDIIPLLFPWNQKGAHRLRNNLLPALERVDRVVTASERTRQDLVEYLGLCPGMVTVIPYGVSRWRFRPDHMPAALDRCRRLYRLVHPYILYVAALDRRKNHALLVKAFATFVRQRREPWLLALAGPGHPGQELMHLIRQEALEERVRFLGHVPDAHLPLIYGAARTFAFPSLYEGFSNPALEAMASGVPVVASSAGAIPEVAGDAALLEDPYDPTAWAEALWHLAEDDSLRARLTARGLIRADAFSWRRSARLHLDFYREVCQ